MSDSIEIKVRKSKKSEVLLELSYSDSFKSHYHTRFSEIRSLLECDDNLVLMAAKGFIQEARLEKHFKIIIKLHKNIPLQAGLGGGSSNAASVLLGLRNILKPEMRNDALVEIAVTLGSDIVAFICQSLIFIHRTGNEFLALSPQLYSKFKGLLQEVFLLVLKPSEGVSTIDAYSSFGFSNGDFEKNLVAKESHLFLSKLSREQKLLTEPISLLHTGISKDELNLIFSSFADNSALHKSVSNGAEMSGVGISDFSFLFNDFEPVLRERCKEVEESFHLLKESGASKCLLAGSGSSIVAFFNSKESQLSAIDFLKHKIPESWFLEKAKFLI